MHLAQLRRWFLRRSVTLLALAIAAPVAHAKDFRALNFGDDCRAVAEMEIERGSTVRTVEPHWRTFSGFYADLSVTIAYWCQEDRFREGTCFFDRGSLAEAMALYEELKYDVIAKHGQPSVDGSSIPLNLLPRDFSGAEASTLVWLRDTVEITLGYTGPLPEGGRRVILGFRMPAH
jgi:hypothetical protein